jgi:pyruvate dehydrogenase E1 component
MMQWSFEHLQAEEGGAVYLRLSTRPLEQPNREMSGALTTQVLAGGYWLVEPSDNAELAIVASGPVLPEAIEAHRLLLEDLPGTGLLVVTSADRLWSGWNRSRRGGTRPLDRQSSHVDDLLMRLPMTAGLVTVLDGHAPMDSTPTRSSAPPPGSAQAGRSLHLVIW